MASSEAYRPYCVKRSDRLISFLSNLLFGSKSFTSQAKWVGNFSGLNLVIGAAPLLPFTAFSQNSETVFPNGVRAPSPVITTRVSFIRLNNRVKCCYEFFRNCFYDAMFYGHLSYRLLIFSSRSFRSSP